MNKIKIIYLASIVVAMYGLYLQWSKPDTTFRTYLGLAFIILAVLMQRSAHRLSDKLNGN